MKIAIIAVIIGVVALVVSIYVSNRKLEITKQSIEEEYPGYKNATSFTVNDAPTPNVTEFKADGSSRQYLSVKKYKKVYDLSEESLNEISKDEWKLISVDQGIAYFERNEMDWVENKGVVLQVK